MPVSDTLADPTAEPNDWLGDVLIPWVDDVADAIAALEAGGGGTSLPRTATIEDYGGLPNNNATLTSAGYASVAAAIAANPTWSTVTGLATSDRVNWAALQAAFNDWTNWDKLLLGGTLQINKALVEPSNATDFLGRVIDGTSRELTQIEQVTANTPVLRVADEGGAEIVYRHINFKHTALAGVSDTDAVGVYLDSAGTPIAWGHHLRTWDHCEWENNYDCISTRGTGFSGFWGCLFLKPIFRNFRHSAIENEPVGAGGLPANVGIDMDFTNTAVAIDQTGPVMFLPNQTWVISGINFEGYSDCLIRAYAGGIHCTGLRVEWHNVTGVNDTHPHVFDLSFGTFTFRGHDISFDEVNIPGGEVGRVWLIGDECAFTVEDITWQFYVEPVTANLHWIYPSGDPIAIRNIDCHVSSVNAFTDVMLDTPPDTWGVATAAIDPIVEWGGRRGGAVTAGAIASSATLSTARSAVVCTNGSAVTGVILAAGKIHGQTVDVVATGAGGITFATDATSNVHGGTGVSVTAGTARRFVWYHDGTTGRWYPQMV